MSGGQKILPPNLSQELGVEAGQVLSLLSLEILVCQHTGVEQETELSLRSVRQEPERFELGRADPANKMTVVRQELGKAVQCATHLQSPHWKVEGMRSL